jgi:hypothetical protein
MVGARSDEIDESLPPGFSQSPDRKCIVTTETFTAGFPGLAWAILLRATKDGCSPEWLRQISGFYELDVNPAIFDRRPHERVKLNLATYHRARREHRSPQMFTFDVGRRQRLVLSWFDALPVFRSRDRVYPCAASRQSSVTRRISPPFSPA